VFPVTGATGDVGRLVVDRLLAAGESARAPTRDPAGARIPAGADVVVGDLTRPRRSGGSAWPSGARRATSRCRRTSRAS
jgi:nucleoside-diphosphate-sugar epimerase